MSETHDLREAGLKVTQPRVKILELLETSEQRHLSAEEVFNLLREMGENKIGLATVYRVLTQFEAAGLVTRHHFEGGNSVFEIDRGTHHDHLVCVKCGKVDEFMDETIEARQKQIAQENGYQMTDHSLHIYGVCGECQQA